MITRDQFVTACSAAAGAFFDAINGVAGAATGDGTAPKYETYISRKGGMVQYASETDLAGLVFWKSKADEPPSDPKYADSNKKQSRYLAAWIAYRQAHPDEVWTGERNKVQVTALPPCDRPATYPREARQASAASSYSAPETSPDEMDDIPFILNVTSDEQERWNAPRRTRA